MITSAVVARDRVQEVASLIERRRAECRGADQRQARPRWWSQRLLGGAVIRDARTDKVVAMVPAGNGDEVAHLIALAPVLAANVVRASAELDRGDVDAAGRTLRSIATVLRQQGVGVGR